MKVAIINSVYKFGSTGKLSYELAEQLNNEGIPAKVFYGRKKQKKDRIGVCFSNPFFVGLSVLKARLFDCDGFVSKHSTKKLIKYLSAYHPDVVIINNLHGYYIDSKLLFLYLRNNNIRVIITTHDCWLITGHCAHFDYYGCELWKTHCMKCPLIRKYPKSLFFDNSFKNYNLKKEILSTSDILLVHPSQWIEEKFDSSFLKSKRRMVINNGIDLNVFQKVKGNFKELNNLLDYKIILTVANVWTKEKGILDIVELSKIIPDDYKIIVVGNYKGKEKPKNILFYGKTKSVSELVNLYSSSDVFFNPTYEDTYPTVNMEAQACSLPVITYDTGGSKELVNKDFVIKQGDVKAALLLMNDLFNKVREYKFIDSKQFDKAISQKKYIDLIKNIK